MITYQDTDPVGSLEGRQCGIEKWCCQMFSGIRQNPDVLTLPLKKSLDFQVKLLLKKKKRKRNVIKCLLSPNEEQNVQFSNDLETLPEFCLDKLAKCEFHVPCHGNLCLLCCPIGLALGNHSPPQFHENLIGLSVRDSSPCTKIDSQTSEDPLQGQYRVAMGLGEQHGFWRIEASSPETTNQQVHVSPGEQKTTFLAT